MDEKTTVDLIKSLEVTSLSRLVDYSKQGTLVEFPPFAEGQPFVARIKRPSLLGLAKGKKIPNSLLSTANGLFKGGDSAFDADNEQAMQDLFDVLDVIADACFVEPKYSDLKDAGIELTDDQYMFIFNYTQKGVQALEDFR